MYGYGIVGNCQLSGLVDATGSLDWLCLPRPDSPPVFGRLLDPEGGHFSISPEAIAESRQEYVPNTNVLTTTIKCPDGSELSITDFCPRFPQHGRMYRPLSFFRIVQPTRGAPKIKAVCRPVNGWSKEVQKPVRGNSHLRFEFGQDCLRLVTNMPLTYICEETFFSLSQPLYFALSWGFGIEDNLPAITNTFLEQTVDYWKTWVKHCSIPSLYQKQTIRSALTLKLHCYEDTGAILAALTTSLPEENGSGRNWDYRFCWLRDASFVLSAFHSLGHFEEMEGFITFLLNLAESKEHSRERLRPVYRLDQSLPLPEMNYPNWHGYGGCKPVRSENQAAEHVQNDVYGELILTFAPIFFDERFQHLRNERHETLLKHLLQLCVKNIAVPDAGLWELRNGWQEHSFSNLMCWAGIERAIRIRQRGFLSALDVDLEQALARAEAAVNGAILEGSLRNGPKDESYDAALLQLPILKFPNRDLCRLTVDAIRTNLAVAGNPPFLYRYLRKDDFGHPQSSFLICSFWLVQALVKTGRIDEAHEVMKSAMLSSNELGLFSEHFLAGESRQAGNFPQAYSHVGQINAAFAVSPPWEEVL